MTWFSGWSHTLRTLRLLRLPRVRRKRLLILLRTRSPTSGLFAPVAWLRLRLSASTTQSAQLEWGARAGRTATRSIALIVHLRAFRVLRQPRRTRLLRLRPFRQLQVSQRADLRPLRQQGRCQPSALRFLHRCDQEVVFPRTKPRWRKTRMMPISQVAVTIQQERTWTMITNI